MNRSLESITLRRDHTAVVIAPERGAIVTSFRVHDRELLYLDEATLNDRSKNVRGGIPILFPTPGKLQDDRFACAGRTGELKQHGFARNLEWHPDALDDSAATLSIAANDETFRAYPWRFKASARFEVAEGSLTMRFAITNQDSSAMPFAFGLHPYFLVHDKARARVPTSAKQAFDNVKKTVGPFSGFDFTQGEVDIHLLDHNSARAALEVGDQTITIEGSPELTRWVIWSIPGKEFICLEPWSAPGNALNTGEGVITLAPGERRELWVKITG